VENEVGDGLFFANTNWEIGISVYLTIYASSAMGLIISSVVKNSDRAMAISPFVLIIQLLFSGAIFSLPEGIGEWLSKLTISRWAMECLGNITNLNVLPRRMAYEDENLAALIPPHHDDLYARSTEHLWHIWVVLLVISVLCGIISVLVLRNLKREQRN
jgi:ABC-type transport system involved in multi-copper enzyme maturation permease subunit